ncbi:FecR domain-containing protein [Pigmentiphaga aceris]|uniref:FecR domain-containing protein n=1 Tax=Pigmentiphaga aceris TaxID=1940612 RepID=UPI001FE9BA92|nr:FecR domain-containing protein [Pigmentiphaga aceris]
MVASDRNVETKADFASLEKAAEWYALFRGAGATEHDHQAWRRWLNQRPEHAKAWTHIESVSNRFEPLRAGGREAAVAGTRVARKGAWSRRRVLGAAGAMSGAGMLGWLAWRHTAFSEVVLAWGADLRTGTGERRDLQLADGSRVWLNTDSAVNVDYQDGMRRLRLLAGEILIDTARDPAQRPFYVDTRFGRMQALGTRFAVRLNDGHTLLNVFEGTVAIRNSAGINLRVEAGQQARFDADTAALDGAADRAREAWSRGVVLADNLSLKTLIEELSRYQHGHIGVAPEIADLKVMGVYPADDLDRALSMLSRNLPIRVQRTLPWWTTVVAR